MTEPTVDELCTQLISLAHERSWRGEGEWPVSRFERWIHEEPEHGWAVLRQLVNRAPHDAEVMSLAAYRVPQLLDRDFERYHDQLLVLLEESSYLSALLGPEVFIEADYAPRQTDPEFLAQVWLGNARNYERAKWPEQLDHDDPGVRLRIALEIIERGPLRGFEVDDLDSPLLDVLRQFGERVIEDIEAAAQQSAAVRLAIWSARRQNHGSRDTPLVPAELWARFLAAAGDTNRCNTPMPPGEARPLATLEDQVVEAWLAKEGTFWAWVELSDLVRDDPERAWQTILAILRGSESLEERACCGAGPFEDLIRAHPGLFIEPAEELAPRDLWFRQALAATWITLEDVPEPLARRYFEASGRELQVLDAPEGWSQDDRGAQR